MLNPQISNSQVSNFPQSKPMDHPDRSSCIGLDCYATHKPQSLRMDYTPTPSVAFCQFGFATAQGQNSHSFGPCLRSQPHICSALCRQSSFPKRLSTLFRTTLAVDHTIDHSTARLLQPWTFSWRCIQQSVRRQIPQCYCPMLSIDICRPFIDT